MNWAHVHIIINHLPVIGAIFTCGMLVLGLVRRSRELQLATLWMAIVVAIATIAVFYTGGPAARQVGGLPGVERSFIRAHSQSADTSFILMEVMGGVAVIGLILMRNGSTMRGWFAGLMLLVSLAVVAMVGWTSNLGGEIRHTEIRSGAQPAPAQGLPPDSARRGPQ